MEFGTHYTVLTILSLTHLDHNSPHVYRTYIIPQNHTSKNNFNFWFVVLIANLLFHHECWPKATWFL